MRPGCAGARKSSFTAANAALLAITPNLPSMAALLGTLTVEFSCIIINEENRKKLRVGDTVIVENYDPLVNIMYRSPLDELYVIE